MNIAFQSYCKPLPVAFFIILLFANYGFAQQGANQPIQPRIVLTSELEGKSFTTDSEEYLQVWNELLTLLKKADDSYTPKVNYDFLNTFKRDTYISLTYPANTALNIKPRNQKIEFRFLMVSIKGRYSGVMIYGKRPDAPETMYVTFNPRLNRLKSLLHILPSNRK